MQQNRNGSDITQSAVDSAGADLAARGAVDDIELSVPLLDVASRGIGSLLGTRRDIIVGIYSPAAPVVRLSQTDAARIVDLVGHVEQGIGLVRVRVGVREDACIVGFSNVWSYCFVSQCRLSQS